MTNAELATLSAELLCLTETVGQLHIATRLLMERVEALERQSRCRCCDDSVTVTAPPVFECVP